MNKKGAPSKISKCCRPDYRDRKKVFLILGNLPKWRLPCGKGLEFRSVGFRWVLSILHDPAYYFSTVRSYRILSIKRRKELPTFSGINKLEMTLNPNVNLTIKNPLPHPPLDHVSRFWFAGQ